MKMSIRLLRNSVLIIGIIVFLLTNCKEDQDSLSTTVMDINGNVYHTITIGTQVWLLENLRTTRYRNGDSIPIVPDQSDWHDQTTGGMCYYNNDSAFATGYGALYNYYAIADPRQIAPVGWHVPTMEEFTTLRSYALNNPGTSGSEAKALASNAYWRYSSRQGAPGNEITLNNYTGFSAQPGGQRESWENCLFISHAEESYFYTCSIIYYYHYQTYVYFHIDGSSPDTGLFEYYLGNGYYLGAAVNIGMSVRCIKDN